MQIDMTSSERWLNEYGDGKLSQYDLVFLLEYAHALSARRLIDRCKNKPLLVISHNSDRHRRHELWEHVYYAADFVVANNRCVFDFFGRPEKSCNISNGVDERDFYVTRPIHEREHRVIWCGSTSVKKGKGYQDVLLPAQSQLESLGFICDFRPIDDINERVVYPSVKQREWYNSASYVVCASSTEGTPNFLLEAMACGCVGVSTEVGNATEFGVGDENIVFFHRSPGRLIDALMYAKGNRERLSWSAEKAMRSWSYGEPGNRAEYFFQLFRRLVNDGPKTVAPFCHLEVLPEQI